MDRSDRHSFRRTWLRRTSMLAAATLVGALTWTMPAAHGAPEKRSTSVDEPGVTANLWEWNWKSIGRECAVLAKDGYTGVQVAPAAEFAQAHRARQWERHDPASVVGGLSASHLRPDEPDGQ